MANPEAKFDEVKMHFLGMNEITTGKMFGSETLKVSDKVFSMLVKKQLVLKLPAPRIAELLEQNKGVPFDPGHGRLMKEWISIPDQFADEWFTLSEEAKKFVFESTKKGKKKR